MAGVEDPERAEAQEETDAAIQSEDSMILSSSRKRIQGYPNP